MVRKYGKIDVTMKISQCFHFIGVFPNCNVATMTFWCHDIDLMLLQCRGDVATLKM